MSEPALKALDAQKVQAALDLLWLISVGYDDHSELTAARNAIDALVADGWEASASALRAADELGLTGEDGTVLLDDFFDRPIHRVALSGPAWSS
mgnify:FL=1